MKRKDIPYGRCRSEKLVVSAETDDAIERGREMFPKRVHQIIENYWNTIGVTDHSPTNYIVYAEEAIDEIDYMLGKLYGFGQYAS